MGWRATSAVAGVALLAGAGGFWWLTRRPAPPAAPVVDQKPPERARPADGDAELAREIRTLRAELLAGSDQRAAIDALSRSQAAVLSQVLSAVLVSRGEAPLPPTATPEDVAAAAQRLGAVQLARGAIGPGPRGDTGTATALLPCDGCRPELTVEWDPPPPPERRPWLERLDRARWWARISIAGRADLGDSAQPDSRDLVGGLRLEGGREWCRQRTGRVEHCLDASAWLGPGRDLGVSAGYLLALPDRD